MKNLRFECYPIIGKNAEVIGCEHSNFNNIKWSSNTKWDELKGWENIENVPHELKQQLGLKDKKEDGRKKTKENQRGRRAISVSVVAWNRVMGREELKEQKN